MKNKPKKCKYCGINFIPKYLNQISCSEKCRKKSYYKHINLTKEQEKIIKSLLNKKTRLEIAKEANTSPATLNRYLRSKGLTSNTVRYDKNIIEKVLKIHAKFGVKKGQEKLDELGIKANIRSICERYPVKKKHNIYWTKKDETKLLILRTLKNAENCGKILDKTEKAIPKKTWKLKQNLKISNIHGFVKYKAMQIPFVKKSCPSYRVDICWAGNKKSLLFWVDVQKNLEDDTPKTIRDAIEALAKFQRWLFGRNAKSKILKIINTNDPKEINKILDKIIK